MHPQIIKYDINREIGKSIMSYVHTYMYYVSRYIGTVFKNKLLTKVDARTNGWLHENYCVKRLSHI